jgi:hypothetical protein
MGIFRNNGLSAPRCITANFPKRRSTIMPALALLWPSETNYPRFRQVCGADLPSSYDAFERAAAQTIRELEARGYCYRKIDVDPDDMVRWCTEVYGAVNAESRAAYAEFSAGFADGTAAGHA